MPLRYQSWAEKVMLKHIRELLDIQAAPLLDWAKDAN
jgi:hypothetical protein